VIVDIYVWNLCWDKYIRQSFICEDCLCIFVQLVGISYNIHTDLLIFLLVVGCNVTILYKYVTKFSLWFLF